jgi:translocation and assembly module TamA
LLGERGHPLAKIVDRRTVVDHSENTMRVTLEVDPGPLAKFGPVAIEGLTDVEEDYVRELIELTPGAIYDQRAVAALRTRLVDTQLFEAVSIDTAQRVDDEGRLPLTIRVTERAPRSVGAGVSYSTDQGFGANAFWEHRNLFGRNEQLRFSITTAEINQEISLDYRVPNFRELDQDLIFSAAGVRQTTDAFDELSVAFFGGIERTLGEHWTVRGGPSLEYSIIDDNIDEETFLLAGLPLSAARDDTNSLLNPTRGTRLSLALTPYYGVLEDNPSFLVSEVTGSAYLKPFDVDWLVLAGRSRVGSIVGAPTEDLPANKRFYAGGGGSIRGYEFQSVGPLDDDDDPLGGRSVFEVSLETRFRVTETIGIVPFVDGGTVFDDVYPDFSETLRWAAGIGFRYYTAIGPIRADIAFPLNPRGGVDDLFQFYVSIGQAF